MKNIARPITATIKDQVYHILKNDICSRYYQPGHWLQEKELAQRLNVSRSPVREALRMLVSDGLVIELPNKGVFVREFTSKDISDIFDLRVMMESYAVTNSPQSLTKKKAEELRQFYADLLREHELNRLERYIDIDTELHRFIIALGGNTIMESTYNSISSMIQPFRIYSLVDVQRFDDSVTEHKNIIDSILSGNVEEAVRATRTHLELARRDILAYLDKSASKG